MLSSASALSSNTTNTLQRAQDLLDYIHNMTERINGNRSVRH